MSDRKFRMVTVKKYRSFVSVFQGNMLWSAPNIQNSNFSASEGNWSVHENILWKLVHPLYKPQAPIQC